MTVLISSPITPRVLPSQAHWFSQHHCLFFFFLLLTHCVPLLIIFVLLGLGPWPFLCSYIFYVGNINHTLIYRISPEYSTFVSDIFTWTRLSPSYSVCLNPIYFLPQYMLLLLFPWSSIMVYHLPPIQARSWIWLIPHIQLPDPQKSLFLVLTHRSSEDLILSHLECWRCCLCPAPSVFPLIWLIFLKPTGINSCHFHALIVSEAREYQAYGKFEITWGGKPYASSSKTGCRVTIHYAIEYSLKIIGSEKQDGMLNIKAVLSGW